MKFLPKQGFEPLISMVLHANHCTVSHLFNLPLKYRDVKRNPENKIKFFIFDNRNSILFFLSFSSRKLHKNYQMSGKINSHLRSMLNVYQSSYKTVKYGWQKIIYYKI